MGRSHSHVKTGPERKPSKKAKQATERRKERRNMRCPDTNCRSFRVLAPSAYDQAADWICQECGRRFRPRQQNQEKDAA